MSDDPTSNAKPPLPVGAKPAIGQTPGGQLRPATAGTNPGPVATGNGAQTTVPPPPPPPPAATLPVGVKPATGQTPGLHQQTTVPAPPKPPGPVIEYTMPVPKRPLAIPQGLGCLVKMIFGFTVLLLLGYFALLALNPKARSWATQGAKDGSGGPTPFKVVNQILAIPAQALGKTDDVVKANNARVGQLDGLVAEEEAKTKGGKPGRAFAPVTDPFSTPSAPEKKPGLAATDTTATESAESQSVSSAAILALAEKRAATGAGPTPARPPPLRPAVVAPVAPDSPDRMKLAGDIIIAHASPAGSPRASAAFFYWVVKLNVGGVTMGKPARVLINNRLIYEGDEVNRTLGVVFVQLDPTNKLLVFRDPSGATVTRSY